MQSANQPTDKPKNEIELGDQVDQLTDQQCRLALCWLSTLGPSSLDGQALMRALAAVRRIEKS
jgi:hypothetical protein